MNKLTIEELAQIELEIDNKISAGTLPKVLYKFRMWDDEPNDYILKNLSIRLASPFELQADYSETILPIDESVIDEEYKDKVAFHEAKRLYPNLDPLLLLLKAHQLRESMTIDIVSEREWAYQHNRQRNNAVRGVFCASYTYKHLDQWVHLAGNATGFAVGLDLKSLYMHSKILGSASFVNYYDETNPPKVQPYSFSAEESNRKTFMELYNVPNRYEYEREFRIVRTNHRYNKEGKVAAYTEEERMISLTPDNYCEILLGIDISDEDKADIINIRNKNLPSVPIFETIKIDSMIEKGQEH